MRKRPPNRLVTTCDKIRDKESGLVFYVHFDRQVTWSDKYSCYVLGPAIQVCITPKSKTGSGLDTFCSELTRVINREIQVAEVTP